MLARLSLAAWLGAQAPPGAGTPGEPPAPAQVRSAEADPAPAVAPTPAWHLSWRGKAAGCDDPAPLAAAVVEFMSGERLPPEVLARVWIDAELRRGGAGLTLHLQVRTPLGVTARRVEVATCPEAVQGAAIVVAVALDPLRVAARATRPAPAPSPSPPQETAPRRRPRPGGIVEVGALMDYGSLDALAGGVRLGLGLALGRAQLALAGVYLGPVEHHPFSDRPQAGARVQLGAAALQACFVPRVGRVELPACAHLEAGAVRGRGLGTTGSGAAHEPWVAAGVGAGLGLRVTAWLALWLRAGGSAVLLRPRFFIDEVGTVYRPPPALFRLSLGPQVRF